MFVFILIFSYFAIPHDLQPKALLWGILGAVVMRFMFIFLGVQLISMFSWTIYVFGALLIFTALKMLLQKEEDNFDPSQSFILKLLKKFMPIKTDYHGENFFVREKDKWLATPLFAAVLVIEMSDLIFAVDSIPAVLSITQDTFLVYSSNIFAIIGLRSLYFLLSGMAGKFPYLKYGISVILFFVGAKMLFGVYKNVTDPKQYELLEMSRISGFVDRARGTGRPTKKERRALDAFVDPAMFGFDEED